ncbi:hypothetical protein COCSUDRAFT_42193 [Coccomyxa subellipsoidea C-169]|uniref:Uncharacterized protein n=1 Tax=Coccomyxa subellipsoidea (strain C-169) TaxID=574566 RepID=I0YY28_COCSC|nr:hypothetical protein COCSUDRAFT_42193 [Coccomyxa subellipsoidea C-169]EIE23297.1 hypothetical protein COCSUDRAFT_42193 [Coccomyxa subellipsoidea C-169]|eukprot:XP_005647841.1 hypothetical protein COCSUDRAFT_42193 [Coccomyxa subellipsoidea C-169]
MSGLVNKVKESLHIGQCSDPVHHHGAKREEGITEGPGGGTHMVRGATYTSSTKNTSDCASGKCDENYKQEGKHVPWEDAQAKTNEASKEAHAAEVYACKAHKHLESVAESQQESERARARLAELERELEGMRNRGVDLSRKNGEIEVARRAAQEAAMREREAHKGCEAAANEAALKEREAAKLQRGLADMRRSLQEIEAELANLQRELEGHSRAVKEAEAALAAVRERHNKTHTHLGSLRAEWEKHLQARKGLEANFNTTRSRLQDVNEREEELSRLLATRRGQLGEHETAAQRATRAAEAERERAAQLKREADPLARDAQNRSAAVGLAEREAAEAAKHKRDLEARERELQSKLQGTQRTVESTTAETRQRVEGYEKYKVEAEQANQRKEELWDEAKHLGGVGDRNADRKIANMEERLQGLDVTGSNKAQTRTTHRETTVVKEE